MTATSPVRYKYPRTAVLPWSPGGASDDRRLGIAEAMAYFGAPRSSSTGRPELVASEKLDGESLTIYRDGWHARSLDSRMHPSRSMAARLQALLAPEIPNGFRFVFENLYARHAIHYQRLPGYFALLSVWTDANICCSVEGTTVWCRQLNRLLQHDYPREWGGGMRLFTPRILFQGMLDVPALTRLSARTTGPYGDELEGYVLRPFSATFKFERFSENLAKSVRPDHVKTDQHWQNQSVVPNLVDPSILDDPALGPYDLH